jgi:hypothetical protein
MKNATVCDNCGKIDEPNAHWWELRHCQEGHDVSPPGNMAFDLCSIECVVEKSTLIWQKGHRDKGLTQKP